MMASSPSYLRKMLYYLSSLPRKKNRTTMLETNRSRATEFYFNLRCLVRTVRCGRINRVPFFLRHIWCALAG